MTLDFSAMHWLVILSAMAFAYVVFGMVGFGTALVASPILALFVPVAKIVPLLALLDMFAALVNVARDGRKADLAELKRLVPMMAIGSLVGATVLLVTRPDALLLVLGIFVVVYAIYSLSGIRPQRRFSAGASVPFGLVGGVFSALFGSGGFVYSIYLSGRIDKKDQLRISETARRLDGTPGAFRIHPSDERIHRWIGSIRGLTIRIIGREPGRHRGRYLRKPRVPPRPSAPLYRGRGVRPGLPVRGHLWRLGRGAVFAAAKWPDRHPGRARATRNAGVRPGRLPGG